ncbi:hypothetical protein [Aurantiacibacter sp. MUD61]|uniref:hypothetical protein n=1 Tax=Aurantiacibacter sp. MUD61 TaxID=3009083 RepID=UPI0022F0D21F|nr:hypothetical protein [Aurantiacibacter sp. MUD61]
MSEKKARGAPRRGPYGGKTRSFATKLTDETMERLEKKAIVSNMSISQAAEAILVQGLNAEDDFQRHFAPPLRSFEASIIRSMPDHDTTDDLSAWSEAAGKLVNRLSDELTKSIAALAAELGLPNEPAPPVKKPRPTRRRKLDLR